LEVAYVIRKEAARRGFSGPDEGAPMNFPENTKSPPSATGRTAPAIPPRGPGKPGASTAAVPRVSVATLLAGGREAVLLHNDTEYRLRITRNGKLILTK
jgi:hemin uptake protein HemP